MIRSSLLLGLLLAPRAWAVDVTLHPGDDVGQLTSNPGPGSTITFTDGTYELDNTISWTGAGTQDQPIVFQAQQGTTPVLQFSGGGNGIRLAASQFVTIQGLVIENTDDFYNSDRQTGLVIDSSSDVTVENVEIRHVGGTGLQLTGNDTNLTLHHVHIHDTRDGSGLYSGCYDASCWTQDSAIDTCWIHDIRGNGARGIYVENGGQGLSIVDNVVYQVDGGGIRTASTEFGDPNTVERNVVWSTVGYGVAVSGAATVRNNIVFNVDGVGIYTQDNDQGSFGNLAIANNTVTDTSDWGIQVRGWAGYDGLVLTNNAVANPVGLAFHEGEGDLDENVLVASNIFTGWVDAPDLDPASGAYAPGGGTGDFANAESWDFYPSSSSLLINAGDGDQAAWVPATDFSGAPRDAAAPDVGAYEYLGSTNPGWVIKEGFKVPGYQDTTGQDLGGCGCSKSGSESAAWGLPLLLLAVARRRRGTPSGEA